MELDLRPIPEGERLSRVLPAIENLGLKEVLTLLADGDPSGLLDSVRTVHGKALDYQQIRWGLPDLPFVVHMKRSRMG